MAIVFSPQATQVEAASAFTSLRSPGQVGLVASHRGASISAPENTLPALQLAIDSTAAFVETDVQLTADGVPVLMHDWTLERTTTGTGPVWAHTAEQLSLLDAGSWYSQEFAGTKIPTLADLLAILRPSGKSAILELKGSWNSEQVQIVVDQVFAAGVQHRVMVASFDLMTLRAITDVAPGIPRIIISRTVVGDPANLAAASGATAIAISQTFMHVDPEAVERIHRAGVGVMIYTLNDEAAWATAVSLGVDGIITDTPTQLDEWLAGAQDAHRTAAND